MKHHVPTYSACGLIATLMATVFVACVSAQDRDAVALGVAVRSDSIAPAYLLVEPEELRVAMEHELQLNYNASATTNAARFFASVVLKLSRKAQARNPIGPPLLLRHSDWFAAFVDAADIDPLKVPLHVNQAHDFQQNVLIDYDVNNVIKSVDHDEAPELAVSVQIGWPETAGGAIKYSYEDTLSKPKLQITNHRLITHRLLDFGDIISFDQVEGMTGRPTTGLLAAIFKVIGEGRISWSRFLIADDGTQVTRGRARKGPFAVTETVYIRPDGTGDTGLPEKTPEWIAIEKRLKKKPKIEYHDWSLPDFEPGW